MKTRLSCHQDINTQSQTELRPSLLTPSLLIQEVHSIEHTCTSMSSRQRDGFLSTISFEHKRYYFFHFMIKMKVVFSVHSVGSITFMVLPASVSYFKTDRQINTFTFLIMFPHMKLYSSKNNSV